MRDFPIIRYGNAPPWLLTLSVILKISPTKPVYEGIDPHETSGFLIAFPLKKLVIKKQNCTIH